MKKIKLTYKHITAILFSVIIFGFFISVVQYRLQALSYHIGVEPETPAVSAAAEQELDTSGLTDWSKIYPIREDPQSAAESVSEAEPPQEQSRIKTLSQKYVSTVRNVEDSIDYYTSKLLFMRMKFVELNAGFNKLIGMKLISGADNIICLADGNLTYYPYYADVSGSAENLSSLADYAQKCGSRLLYVQAPSKIDPDNNYLPGGIDDNDNIKADEFLSALKSNGVEYLDLRQSMKEQKMNFTDSFYRTDHHWKADTGFWATNQIAQKLHTSCGMPYNGSKLDIRNYDEKIYKNYMFGSIGKTVSLAYADPEDISIITPKFDTDYTVDYFDFRHLEGSFKDTMINYDVLKKIDYYNTSTYSAYFYGVTPLVSVVNNKADNDCRVLFVGDSFSSSVVPYLSTQVKYIDKIDINYYNGGLESYIEKNKPDIVVVMLYPGALQGTSNSSMRFR